ncbi:RNA-binding protein, partial [Listeria monocytogenes]|nr:RNA-binding protein [Listeria monocytogenes]
WEDVVYITDYLQKEGIVVMGTLPNEREYPF